MRNRVRLESGRSLVLAILAVGCWGLLALPRSASLAAPESGAAEAAAAAQQTVDRLQRQMELAFLDVQRDHAHVRLDEWARSPFGDTFTTALKELVRGARPPSPARSADEDAAAASEVVRRLAERNVEPPLTFTSLPVVLAQTARAARTDTAASERDLFLAAARETFAEATPADSWDARFLGLPVVVAFRDASAKLVLAQEKAAAPPPAAAPAPAAEDKPAAKTATEPVKLLDEMVICDRTKAWVGPWTGWTTDIAEKQNKRTQRTLKVVWIDRYEVTCAQYRAFLETLAPAARRPMLPQGWTLGDDDAVQMPEGKDRHPVTGVTFEQAQTFAESLGKRLPTCDEWERAAGGVDKEPRAFPWGADADGRSWANSAAEPAGTFAVDAFPDDTTPEGVVGLAGNVAEIVATYPDRADVGKSSPEKGRQVVVCGGSFKSRASECGTSWRWVLDADGASASVGFRCVMDDAEYRKRHK